MHTATNQQYHVPSREKERDEGGDGVERDHDHDSKFAYVHKTRRTAAALACDDSVTAGGQRWPDMAETTTVAIPETRRTGVGSEEPAPPVGSAVSIADKR
jgi:hypothetical protein